MTKRFRYANLTVLEQLVQFTWEVRNVHGVFTGLRGRRAGRHPSRGGPCEQEVSRFYQDMEGKSAEEVRDKYEVHTLPMTYSGRFVAENEGETGLCKMLIDKRQQTVLGVHMIGNPCSEFVAAASFAVRMGYTVPEFKQVVFPHPTVSEILKEVLETL